MTLCQQPKLPFPWSGFGQNTVQAHAALDLLAFLQSLDVLLLLLTFFGVLFSLFWSERVETLFAAGAADVSVHVGALAATWAVAGCCEGADWVFSWVDVTNVVVVVVVIISFL